MVEKNNTDTKQKLAALRGALAERRVVAARRFSDFSDAPVILCAQSRPSLNELLSRIKVNSHGVIYGEVREGLELDLPVA